MSEARDKCRAATLGAPAVRASKMVEWNGTKFEIRSPSFLDSRRIANASVVGLGKKAKTDNVKALAHALIASVYVPGTDERVYEAADVDAMESRTAEDFVGFFARAVGEVNAATTAESAEKNSESAQTEEP